MSIQARVQQALSQPFGSVLTDHMAISRYQDGDWSELEIIARDDFRISAAAHALCYGSTCFEGLKAFRHADGPAAFRLLDHARRMQRSAAALHLPAPSVEQFVAAVERAVTHQLEWLPEPPGALYVRPILLGVEESIGSAAAPSSQAVFYVLTAPAGVYFKGGLTAEHALRVAIEPGRARTAPGFGHAKAGANYAPALGTILAAKREHQVAQVLFAPNDVVEETGAANIALVRGNELLTPALNENFLHGITRDSVLQTARDLGYRVREEEVELSRMLNWVREGEMLMTGTAAVVTGVGELVHEGELIQVGDGNIGPHTRRIRAALTAIQHGEAPDPHGWIRRLG